MADLFMPWRTIPCLKPHPRNIEAHYPSEDCQPDMNVNRHEQQKRQHYHANQEVRCEVLDVLQIRKQVREWFHPARLSKGYIALIYIIFRGLWHPSTIQGTVKLVALGVSDRPGIKIVKLTTLCLKYEKKPSDRVLQSENPRAYPVRLFRSLRFF